MDDMIIIGDIKFKYNAKEEAYGTIIDMDGNKVLVKSYDLDNIKMSLKIAAKLIKELSIDALKEFIARTFYDNESEDLGLTRDEFKEAIDLDVITIDKTYIEYWFDDGEIYGGHSIVLTNKIGEEKMTIEIAG